MVELSRRSFLSWVAAASVPIFGGIKFQKAASRSGDIRVENLTVPPGRGRSVMFSVLNGEPIVFMPDSAVEMTRFCVTAKGDGCSTCSVFRYSRYKRTQLLDILLGNRSIFMIDFMSAIIFDGPIIFEFSDCFHGTGFFNIYDV